MHGHLITWLGRPFATLLVSLVLDVQATAQEQASQAPARDPPQARAGGQVAAGALASAPAPASGTVPMTLEMQSPIVTLSLRTAAGGVRATRFFVDTGGGALILTEGVADEVGLAIHREDTHEDEKDMFFARMDPPHLQIDGFPLDLTGALCVASIGRASVLPGCTAEGFLPARVLANHHVVFDYPAGRFTLARPGACKPHGAQVPSPVSPTSRFPRIEMVIEGAPMGFLLDTGASFSMLSINAMKSWRIASSDHATLTGAIGEANMMGGPMECKATLVRMPAMQWGPFALDGVVAVSRNPDTYEKYMSQRMTAPIVGAIGGNVLRHFRVEIDYAAGITYLEPGVEPGSGPSTPHDFATHLTGLGIVFGIGSDGGHLVDAIASAGDQPLCTGVQVGDVLIAVDEQPVTALAHRQLIDLLRGEPGTGRVLTLLRDGTPHEVTVPVIRAFP